MEYKTKKQIKGFLFGVESSMNYGGNFPGLVPIMFGPLFPLYYAGILIKDEISEKRSKRKQSELTKILGEESSQLPNQNSQDKKYE